MQIEKMPMISRQENLSALVDGLNSLRSLGYSWDGTGGLPVRLEALGYAIEYVAPCLNLENLAIEQVTLTPCGVPRVDLLGPATRLRMSIGVPTEQVVAWSRKIGGAEINGVIICGNGTASAWHAQVQEQLDRIRIQ